MKIRLPQSPAKPTILRFFSIATVAASVLIALSACNGGDDGPTGSETPDPTSASSTDGATDGDQTLDGLIDSYLAGADGKITYRTTSENFGEHPNLIWTEYRLGADLRIDWRNYVENPADDPMVSTIAIIRPNAAYICTTSPGIESCNTKTQDEAESLVFWRPTADEAIEALAEGIDGVTISSPAAREIAGVQASCFDIELPSRIGTGPAGTESLELCFSHQASLLVMSRTVTFNDAAYPTARLDITAQEVSEVTAADFEPIASPLN